MERKTKVMAALNHLTPLDIFNAQSNDPSRVLRIQGWPIIAEYVIDQIGIDLSDEDIKYKLCEDLAIQLYKQNMIEFTKEFRAWPDTGKTHCRARIFAVPNTEVQLLRLQGIIK